MNTRRHREELGDVGPVVGLALLGADPLVGGDGYVPAVEGDHRQHVQDREHDVDGDEEDQDRREGPPARTAPRGWRCRGWTRAAAPSPGCSPRSGRPWSWSPGGRWRSGRSARRSGRARRPPDGSRSTSWRAPPGAGERRRTGGAPGGEAEVAVLRQGLAVDLDPLAALGRSGEVDELAVAFDPDVELLARATCDHGGRRAELVSVNPLPFMETMTSPALSPASAAGVVFAGPVVEVAPSRCSSTARR